MKLIHSVQCASALAIVGLTAALLSGCDKQTSMSSGSTSSVEKTSFKEVTSQLDPGGEFYMYLGTAQWLDGLSGKIDTWRSPLTSLPGMSREDTENVGKVFDIVTRLIKDSGIEDISGVGLSSIKIEKDMYRNKVVLHHYAGKGDGFLWKLSGKEAHPLTGLDMLPADTAMALFSDLDVPLLWTNIAKEIAQSKIPQAQEFLTQMPAEFEKNVGIKWDTLLQSLGSEFGFILTLNPTKNIVIPIPGNPIQAPEPGILIALKINDDTLFNRIDKELKSNPQVISVDKANLKMRTMPIPLPLPIDLRPSMASTGGYLLIASTDSLINDVVAVKSGQKPGLKSTPEFKRISKGIPDRGNEFAFVSQRFSDSIMQVYKKALTANKEIDKDVVKLIQGMMTNEPSFAYSVSANTAEGSITIGNSSQGQAASILIFPAASAGMLAAIAIPNFIKAREAAQGNACINNLRQIDAAKQQWGLENNKKNTDTPTMKDLQTYLGNRTITCPQGGTYTIGSLSEAPECSIPNHRMP
jgi:hypothetical protein